MSTSLLIAAHEVRRQLVQAWIWLLAAMLFALLAWQYLTAIGAYLEIGPRLAAMPNAPGVTDLIAIPLLRGIGNLLLIVVPLLTMRSFAGDRREHSLVLLLAAGVGDLRIVIGKFLGALSIIWSLLALAALLAWSLRIGAPIDIGRLAAAQVGLMLHAMALTAIGIASSAWASQPVLAAAGTFALSMLLGIVDIGARLEGSDRGAINYLSTSTHVEPFLRGIVSSVDVVYFLLLTGLALAIATLRVEASRRSP